MRELKLTNDPRCAIVDDDDFEYLKHYTWSFDRYTNRVRCNSKYAPSRRLNLIIAIVNNLNSSSAEYKLIYRNNNILDNRKSNLELSTTKNINLRSNRKQQRATSKYRGVDFHKKNRKWVARIKVNKNQIYLGSFQDQNNAAEAYNEAAVKYHGQYAQLNVI